MADGYDIRQLLSFRGDANGSGLLAGPMTGSASNPESRDSPMHNLRI